MNKYEEIVDAWNDSGQQIHRYSNEVQELADKLFAGLTGYLSVPLDRVFYAPYDPNTKVDLAEIEQSYLSVFRPIQSARPFWGCLMIFSMEQPPVQGPGGNYSVLPVCIKQAESGFIITTAPHRRAGEEIQIRSEEELTQYFAWVYEKLLSHARSLASRYKREGVSEKSPIGFKLDTTE